MQVDATSAADDRPKTVAPITSASSKQKIVVATLLFILLIAVMTQPKPSIVDAVATTTLRASEQGFPVDANVSDEELETAEQFSQVRELSRISIDEVRDSRVFAAEAKIRRKVVVGPLKVQAIYGTNVLQSALVGDSIVRSGTDLPGGRRVLAISNEGVHLAP